VPTRVASLPDCGHRRRAAVGRGAAVRGPRRHL